MMPSGLPAEPNSRLTEVTVCTGLCRLTTSTVVTAPLLKKRRERPSGDQNGRQAPSVPGSFSAVTDSIERSQSSDLPPASANAMRLPSGDTDRSRAFDLNGGANENRTAAASGVLRVK